MTKEKKKIVMFHPFVTEAQRKAVNETLKTRWIGQGPKVDQFEEDFKKKFKIPYAVAVNSGSAAIETVCDLLDLSPGDKVITTPLTCTATNLPFARRGCQLLFADIRKDTLNIDPDSVERLIELNPDVKLIINVHLGGIKSDLPSHASIPTLDDAAQALGIYRGNAANYTAYSFQAIKHITTGDGGMFVCRNEEEYRDAKLLRWFGIDREKKIAANWEPIMHEREMTFDIELLGWKRQMTDIAASMGIEGVKAYDAIMEKRRQIFEVYRSIKVGGFRLVDSEENVYWLATALVDRRADFRKKLADRGVETNLVQVRNDIYKVFGGQRLTLPNLNEIENQYISIPLHNVMTVEDAQYIKQVIEEGW